MEIGGKGQSGQLATSMSIFGCPLFLGSVLCVVQSYLFILFWKLYKSSTKTFRLKTFFVAKVWKEKVWRWCWFNHLEIWKLSCMAQSQALTLTNYLGNVKAGECLESVRIVSGVFLENVFGYLLDQKLLKVSHLLVCWSVKSFELSQPNFNSNSTWVGVTGILLWTIIPLLRSRFHHKLKTITWEKSHNRSEKFF